MLRKTKTTAGGAIALAAIVMAVVTYVTACAPIQAPESGGHYINDLGALYRKGDATGFDTQLRKALASGWRPKPSTNLFGVPLVAVAGWASIRDPAYVNNAYGEDRSQEHRWGKDLTDLDDNVCCLLRLGHDPNAQIGKAGLLYWAVRGNKPELVAVLLTAGAEPDAQADISGETALMHAQVLSIATMLLEAGADVSRKDKRGKSVLDRLRSRKHTSSQRAVLYVVEHWHDLGASGVYQK